MRLVSYLEGVLAESSEIYCGTEYELAPYLTDDGCARRSLVRGLLDLNETADRDVLLQLYPKWLADDLHLVLKRTNVGKFMLGLKDAESWVCVKARKRGNDIDADRSAKRLKQVADNIREYALNPRPGLKQTHTRAVSVTFTYRNPKYEADLNAAWENVGKDWNRFLSRLKNAFKTHFIESVDGVIAERHCRDQIHVIRSWEAHESGMVHVHAILCFEHSSLKIDYDQDKPRVHEKDKIAECWPHGFIDVLPILENGVDKQIENVTWYVLKNKDTEDYHDPSSWPRKRFLTQSILWYTGKRSYAISRKLAARPARLESALCITQTLLAGDDHDLLEYEWEFLGLCRTYYSGLDSNDWYRDFKEPPDWLEHAWKPVTGVRAAGALGGTWDN